MKKYLNSLEEIAKTLKEGKEVFEDGSDVLFKNVDGILTRFDGNKIYFGAQLLFCPRTYYCYEEDPLKLETGKLYKIKDSRKAFICWTDDEYAYGCIEHWSKLCKWNREGGRADGPGNTDIIEEWS